MLKTETWENMHSEAKIENEPLFEKSTNFTKSGICKFGCTTLMSGIMVHSVHSQRDGWFGWMGTGGSVMQWHPELKIGFSYVPTDYIKHDFAANRAAWL